MVSALDVLDHRHACGLTGVYALEIISCKGGPHAMLAQVYNHLGEAAGTLPSMSMLPLAVQHTASKPSSTSCMAAWLHDSSNRLLQGLV
jgi:hypothetical protein